MKAFNATNGTWLATDLEVADTFWRRLVGLLGRTSLRPCRGLWIRRCDSIHSLGMLFPIDVLFLDRKGRVVRAIHRLPPFRIIFPVKCASSVIELPAHTISQTRTQEGDVKGDFQRAFSHFSHALGASAAHNNVGFLLLQAGKIAESIEHLQEAIRIDPESEPALANLVTALHAARRWDEAEQAQQQLLDVKKRLLAKTKADAGPLSH
jgi:hypothetical protein